MNPQAVHVGIIGCGTVGTGVVRCLLENERYLRRHLGFPLNLVRVADLCPRRNRGIKLPRGLMTKNANSVLDDPDIEIVVELIGGTTTAKEIILRAMRSGKHVVTANKALLAEAAPELYRAAGKYNVDMFYEASVAGGIPIIKALREAFVGNRIDSVWGILNGTCNYILTRMTDAGLNFSDALAEAQAKGYAEADPTLDIGGFDSQHKIGILASLAFGQWIPQNKIHVEGITSVSAFDIKCAAEMGYTIKLLGIARVDNKTVSVRVHPTFIPSGTMLANVKDAFNAVEVDGYPIGTTVFNGLGAGMGATSSAVVADIVDIARNIGHGSHRRLAPLTFMRKKMPLLPMKDIETRYYLRCSVDDKPGVIAQIARALGTRNISISSVIQHEPEPSEPHVNVTFMTHRAREENISAAVRAINKLASVKQSTVLFRVECD